MDPSEPLLTTEDVANFLKVDVVTVRRLVSRNEIAAYRIGNEFRFSMSDVREFLERQHIPARPSLNVLTLEKNITEQEQGFLKIFMSQLRVPPLRGASRAATAPSRGGLLRRFSQPARQALGNAQQEATRFDHPYVGTEHLLLGLIRDQEGIAGQVLSARDIELDRARQAVELIVGRGEAPAERTDPELTAGAKKTLEYALEEATKLGHEYIGTEHLLLGLTRKGEGAGAQTLQNMGVDLQTLRDDVLGALRAGPSEPPARREPTSVIEAERGFLEQLTGKRSSKAGLLSKLTKRAKSGLVASVQEAHMLDKPYIGTEHVLLGLLTAEDSAAAKALTGFGVTYDAARDAAATMTGSEPIETQPDRNELPMTVSTQRVIERAFEEAKKLGHGYVGTEHLLLGLVLQETCVGHGVLELLMVDFERLRAELIKPNQTMNDE